MLRRWKMSCQPAGQMFGLNTVTKSRKKPSPNSSLSIQKRRLIVKIQKVINLQSYHGEYHNFFYYDFPGERTLKGMISDGWTLKETFGHIQNQQVTLLFEKEVEDEKRN